MEFDLINAIYAGGIVFIMFYIFKIPLMYYIIILGHLFLVFLTNDFLFPISYMPDQLRYIHSANLIRETLDFLHYYQFDRIGYGNVSNAALFFAIFPIPFLSSVFSIAIINVILYSIIFIFLYRKKFLRGKAIWFYLFYPSLALYAAIGGRDTLILLIMIISVYFVYKKKYILSIMVSSLLLFIKFQNFFIFLLSLLLYIGIDKGKIFSIKNIFKYIVAILGVILFINFFSIEEIDTFRRNMFVEDGGDIMNYVPVSGYFDLTVKGLIGSLYMILKPLPWESHNLFQLIQSIENIIIFYLIYRVVLQLKKVKDKFKYFLIIYFLIAMAIYGIVVFNFGTAARYKYTFIVIFVIFGLKLINDNKIIKRVSI